MAISSRIRTGILSALLLPAIALASDNASSAPKKPTEADAASTTNAPSPAPIAGVGAIADPLVRLLVNKGVLNASEVSGLTAVPAGQMRDQLLLLLKAKGVLSEADLSELNAAAPSGDSNAGYAATAKGDPQGQTGPPQPPQTPAPAGPIPAVAPIRVLQADSAKHEGFIPDIKIGKNINLKPYGFIKASAVYDTSSPYGNDFPLPGFNAMPNTVNMIPEFHVKARFVRVGTNFEWVDSPGVVVTGKIEGDFEGNFSRANNRNISSIRTNMFSLRAAYGRVDFKPSDATSIFLLAGQDWTPFASSTLPNLFETTGLGVGFGTLYERNPQIRGGFQHNFGSFQLTPEVAVVLPAFGQLPSDVANQLGFGERQGVDSAKPELQARVVAQWQLDHAKGVAPAQIIVSGVRGKATIDVAATDVPVAFRPTFPNGAQDSRIRMAWTGEIQLPTRYVTVIAKYYNGNDLRYYFGGQIFGPFNNTTGLTATATAPSLDGSSTVVFGCLNGTGPGCVGGTQVLANVLAPRAQGGFVNIGIPLSRWFNADPSGRNAGWVLYAHYGYDQVLARDVRRLGGGRQKGDVGAGTLQYKLNNFVTFVAEESYYRTRALPLTSTGNFPLFAGRPMRLWHDFRSEVGPLFTF